MIFLDKRSFVLGLGIGIIVSVIIIWSVYKISGIGNDDITDSEIEENPIELGMEHSSEESSEISSEIITYAPAVYEAETSETEIYNNSEEFSAADNITGNDAESERRNVSANITQNKKTTENNMAENDTKAKDVFSEDLLENSAEASVSNEENSPIEQTDESFVDITINAGTNARRVSNMFEEKGIIDDAAEYEKFLIDNNKTKNIRTGNYKIPQNIGYEDLTKIISERPQR